MKLKTFFYTKKNQQSNFKIACIASGIELKVFVSFIRHKIYEICEMECLECIREGGVCGGHPVRTRCYANTGTPTEVRHRYRATKQHVGGASHKCGLGQGGVHCKCTDPAGWSWSKH